MSGAAAGKNDYPPYPPMKCCLLRQRCTDTSVVYCNYADCLMADCFLSVYAITSHSLVCVRSQRPNSNGIRASTTKRLLYSSICVEQALNLPNLLLQLTT